ncbi:MAG TPA: hypothetical protein VIE65_03425, partial [Methylobacter sp.]
VMVGRHLVGRLSFIACQLKLWNDCSDCSNELYHFTWIDLRPDICKGCVYCCLRHQAQLLTNLCEQ